MAKFLRFKLLVLVLILTSSLCCSLEDDTNTDAPGHSEFTWAVNLLSRLPVDNYGSHVCINIERLQELGSHTVVYQDTISSLAEWFKSMELNLESDVNCFCDGIIQTKLPQHEFEKRLISSGWEKSDHRGFNFWKLDDLQIILDNGFALSGLALDDQALAMFVGDQDNPLVTEAGELLASLPSGYAIVVEKERMNHGYLYDGLIVSASCTYFETAEIMGYSAISKFSSPEITQTLVEEIQADMESDKEFRWRNIHITIEGHYVEVTADLLVSDLFESGH